MTRDLQAFEALARRMSPQQLIEARRILKDLIEAVRSGGGEPVAPAPPGAERRTEPRFAVNLRGTVRPLIPGQGDQVQTTPIAVLDVSRQGMRFVVDSAEALYPIVEVTFNAPSGRLRTLFCRLVRTRFIRRTDELGHEHKVTEVAARAIDANELAGAQRRLRDLVAATKRIPSREQLPIFLVGSEGRGQKMYAKLLDRKGFPLTVVENYDQLRAAVAEDTIQVVVYIDGRQALLRRDVIEQIGRQRPSTIQMAVIHAVEDRKPLMETGIDECVHAVNAESLMIMYIDRAVKAKLISGAAGMAVRTKHLLIHADDNMALAQLGSRFDPRDYHVTFAHDVDGMLARLRCTEVDAVLADHTIAARENWALVKGIRDEMPDLPIIVAVTDPRLGPDAILAGASDYLPMPFAVRTAGQLITAAIQATEADAALRSALPPGAEAA
ncbi:MAG: hypothetical protein GX591_06070 [Planctomycetes bacterium]|nr:hypothetical protein [Planctomycetota bacterium]